MAIRSCTQPSGSGEGIDFWPFNGDLRALVYPRPQGFFPEDLGRVIPEPSESLFSRVLSCTR